MFIPVRLDGPVSRVHPDGGVLLVVECPEVAAVPGQWEGESQWRLAGTHLSPQAQDRLDTTHQGDNTAPEGEQIRAANDPSVFTIMHGEGPYKGLLYFESA